MKRSWRQPWLVYLTGGIGLIGLYYALPWNSSAQAFVYDGIGISSAAAVVAGTLINRPTRRLPWYLFAAGLLSFAIGDTIFNVYADILNTSPPVPSAADAFYLAGYPFLAGGLALLILRFDSAQRRAGLVDAAMVTASFALAQWVFVMHGQLQEATSSGEKAIALAYPAMDIVLLSGLAIFFLAPTWRTVSYRFMLASIVLLVVGDEINAVSGYAYVNASWLDSTWLLSYVLWGVAALHPSMTSLSERRPASPPRLTTARFALLAAALLTAPVVYLVQRGRGESVDILAIVLGASVLGLLVLVRMVGLVKALDRLREEERSARTNAEDAHRLIADQNERLREADRLKDEFVALISHDLRTPLTSIMGYLELAMDCAGVDERQYGYLEIVQRNSDRLLNLVNDLLFVARLEAGQLELNWKDLDIAAIARQSVEEAEPRANAKRIELTCFTEEVPLVSSDKGRMFQLFDNLISNAIKFTPDGGKIEVRVTGAAGRVCIEVSDTGIGIASDEQRQLFDRFFRATSARDGQVPGTGLGLYIARAIVDAHGGEISVESTQGSGTSFQVGLPAVPVPLRQVRELVT
ncbi:MAG TPA: HAMP domain-containing sensor histidine kinase [Gaiellaceae bacterium]|nr:HAMP domain-containing sensor histidine kinase [Gaiellaceae bacterium]